MTGTFRDGTGISFAPPSRVDTRGRRLFGAFLVLYAIGLLAFGAWASSTSDDVRNANTHVPGVLIGYIERDDGQYAQVSYEAPNLSGIAESREPVARASANTIGRTFTVYYDPQTPTLTYIDGIDQLDSALAVQLIAGGAALLGAGLIVAPKRGARR